MRLPENRVAVKICGITQRADAFAAVDAGADILGFNTWGGTKRRMDLRANAEWLTGLPVFRVALAVNASLVELRELASLPFIDAIQLHGDEDVELVRALVEIGKPVIRAIRVGSPADLATLNEWSTPHILVDAQVRGAYGGTGTAVNPEYLRGFRNRFPELKFWLAGGLTPENVGALVKDVSPHVVDVSSGVELAIGRKDPQKMTEFVREARQAGVL